MEPKKNPAKDVHRYYGQFFLAGLCISIITLILIFEWRSKIRELPPHDPPPFDRMVLIDDLTEVRIEKTAVPKQQPVQVMSREITTGQFEETIESITEPFIVTDLIEPLIIHPVTLPTEPLTDTFIIVQQMPVPLVGFERFYKELNKMIRYPQQARKMQIEGTVYIEFVINSSGEPVNMKVIKGIGGGCDEEAIKALASLKWKPGKQRGVAVPVKKVIPVSFRLN